MTTTILVGVSVVLFTLSEASIGSETQAGPAGAKADPDRRVAISTSRAVDDGLEAIAVRRIEARGGSVIRDRDGSIAEVSLARTWATDEDLT